jgi:hypothetical protein
VLEFRKWMDDGAPCPSNQRRTKKQSLLFGKKDAPNQRYVCG